MAIEQAIRATIMGTLAASVLWIKQRLVQVVTMKVT